MIYFFLYGWLKYLIPPYIPLKKTASLVCVGFSGNK